MVPLFLQFKLPSLGYKGSLNKYSHASILHSFTATLSQTCMVTRYFICHARRATDEGSLPEIVQYSPYYLPLNVFTATKGSNLYILFALTAAGVVPCSGPKKSPRTLSIVRIIFEPRREKTGLRGFRPGLTQTNLYSHRKVQVGKDQEKAQSEKDSHSKNRGGKKPN